MLLKRREIRNLKPEDILKCIDLFAEKERREEYVKKDIEIFLQKTEGVRFTLIYEEGLNADWSLYPSKGRYGRWSGDIPENIIVKLEKIPYAQISTQMHEWGQ